MLLLSDTWLLNVKTIFCDLPSKFFFHQQTAAVVDVVQRLKGCDDMVYDSAQVAAGLHRLHVYIIHIDGSER